MTIIFEYYNKDIGCLEEDQLEVTVYQEFKDWIEDNKILNYEIIDIVVEV